MVKPRITQLEPEVAEAVTEWVDRVEREEVWGLWIWGGPRVGTSHAGLAALTELGRVSAYTGQDAIISQVFAVFQDLKGLWDASTFIQGHASDSSAWAYRDDLDQAQDVLWDTPVLMLNDWSRVSLSPENFMRFFYPRVRGRISAHKPTIIVARFDPSVTGEEEIYFREEFIVTKVNVRADLVLQSDGTR